jgi:quinol monooxygenase YgiN
MYLEIQSAQAPLDSDDPIAKQDLHGGNISNENLYSSRASVRMKFVPDKFAEARDILLALVEPTQFTPGCLGCDIYQDLRERYVLLFEQWWETQADLDRYLRSDPYRSVLVTMEMAMEHPLIRFSEISHSAGLEAIERARSLTVH